jgi:hypothetical protein
MLIPPFVIFKGVRFRDIYKQDFPAESEFATTDSVISMKTFLSNGFSIFRSIVLRILDGHASHSPLKCMDYCQENDIEKLRRVPRGKASDKDVLPISPEDRDENTPCGFCSLKNYSVQYVENGDLIRCQKCGTCYHEVCVGAVGRKHFICGRYL